MNINVPTQVNSSALNNTQFSSPDMGDVTSLLFALLFNNLLGMEHKAEGQTTEEPQSSNLLSPRGLDPAQNLIGQTGYLQVLQNLFPAGMEANFGTTGAQAGQSDLSGGMPNIALSDIQSIIAASGRQNGLSPAQVLALTQALTSTAKASDLVALMNDNGLARSANSVSGESQSLQFTELDKYIALNQQLQALFGRIELGGKQDSLQNRQDRLLAEYGIQINPAQTAAAAASEEPGAHAGQYGQAGKDMIGKGMIDTTGQPEAAQESSDSDAEFLQILTAQNAAARGAEKPVFPENRIYDAQNILGQVLDMLKRQDLKHNDVKELIIHLHPAELGKLQISLRSDNGLVNLVINASEPATGQFLQNYTHELRSGLAQAGVDCGSLEMGQQGQSGSEAELPQGRAQLETADTDDVKTLPRSAAGYYSYNGAGSKLNVSA